VGLFPVRSPGEKRVTPYSFGIKNKYFQNRDGLFPEEKWTCSRTETNWFSKREQIGSGREMNHFKNRNELVLE
jgi:hypothetical protein